MEAKQQNNLVLAIKRCIEANNHFNWDEFAYVTNGKDIFYKHPRLFRSLGNGDEDYGSCIFDVIKSLLQRDPANLQVIIDFIGLEEWLKKHHIHEFEKLFGHTQPILDATEQSAISNSFELNQHIARIRRAVESDPELAIGSTKEMLESILKTILEGFHEDGSKKEDMPDLLKRVQKLLKLDPSAIDSNAKGYEIIKRTLSNLGQVVTGINELRGIYGTGHGRVRNSGISPRHARLVVGAGSTLAIFLMETYEMHQQSAK